MSDAALVLGVQHRKQWTKTLPSRCLEWGRQRINEINSKLHRAPQGSDRCYEETRMGRWKGVFRVMQMQFPTGPGKRSLRRLLSRRWQGEGVSRAAVWREDS